MVAGGHVTQAQPLGEISDLCTARANGSCVHPAAMGDVTATPPAAPGTGAAPKRGECRRCGHHKNRFASVGSQSRSLRRIAPVVAAAAAPGPERGSSHQTQRRRATGAGAAPPTPKGGHMDSTAHSMKPLPPPDGRLLRRRGTPAGPGNEERTAWRGRI